MSAANMVSDLSLPTQATQDYDIAMPGGRMLTMRLKPRLTHLASKPSGLDDYAVRMDAGLDPTPIDFLYQQSPRFRERGIEPLTFLRTIAGDLLLFAQIPRGALDMDRAADWLFDNGYAVYPTDSYDMARHLEVRNRAMSLVLETVQVTPKAWADAVYATPFTPRT